MPTHSMWPRRCSKCYRESQTPSALVNSPNCCHCFQLKYGEGEGRREEEDTKPCNKGKNGNVTDDL